MRNYTQYSIFAHIASLFLVCLFLVLMIPSPAQADVGVHPVLPGGSNIQPEGDSPIQMAAEIVSMNVRLATEADNAIIKLNPEAYGLQFQPIWYPVVAQVEANFTMHNPTSDTVSLTAWFPLASSLESVTWELNPDEIVPYIASFQVAVDGNQLDFMVNILPNPKGTDKPPLPWASFPVTFTLDKDTIIHISYLLPLTQAVKGSELALYYIFQTGAGWAGPIGKAELNLNLPYPASTATLARFPSSSLNLPYSMSDPRVVIPFDGITEGNQAHWIWTNFEPTTKDDFSLWLVDPVLWQDMEAARAAVQVNPQDGQVWLNLANIYRTLSIRGRISPSIFSESYLPLGMEAYQKAAELLPEHPVPHTGMALLSLALYMTDLNAPSEVIGFVQEQLRIARELETAHPNLAEQADISSWMLEDALNIYFYDITATADYAASSTASAKDTETAAMRLTPPVTPSPEPSPTPSEIPSVTSKPSSPTPSATATHKPTGAPIAGLPIFLLAAVLVIILTIIVLPVLRRLNLKV